MQNVTLAFVIDRITEVYGRMTPRIKSRLTADLNMWMARAARRWNFWFLDVPPGLYIPTSFPVDFTTLATAVDPVASCWVDRGWLLTSAGKVSYPVAAPDYVLTDALAPPARSWRLMEIGRLMSVKLFNSTGTQKKEIEILPHVEFTAQMRYDAANEPSKVTWETDNGVSSIIFTPKPDQAYLMQVAIRMAEVPALVRASSSNAFLQNYPDVVITAGLIIAARYFGEVKELQAYYTELFGADYAQKRGSDQTPGGLIGEMIADTRKRMTPRQKSLKVYTSARRAAAKQRPIGLRYDIRWWGWL